MTINSGKILSERDRQDAFKRDLDEKERQRREQWAEARSRMQKLPTSELKSRLNHVLWQMQTFADVALSSGEDFLTAAVALVDGERVAPAPHGEKDPLSLLDLEVLRKLGRAGSDRHEFVEKLIGLDDAEFLFVESVVTASNRMGAPSRAFLRHILGWLTVESNWVTRRGSMQGLGQALDSSGLVAAAAAVAKAEGSDGE